MARAAAARPAGRRRRARRLAAHRRRGRLPADRLRERHQPHAGARGRAPAGVRRPGRHRRGPDRLARLALAESLLLALAAGGVGLLWPSRSCRRSSRWRRRDLRASPTPSIDVRVFVVAVLLVVITGMAIGLWPAFSVFRAGAMQGCGRRARHRRARSRVSGSRWLPHRSR